MARTVLVVDDDRQIVDLLSDLFTEEGYHVRCAFDGQMALDAVEHGRADLVVTDVMMPGLDGVTLARRLRARSAPIPVILVSAVQGAVELPGVPFLPKPFDLEDIVAVANRLLGRRAR